MVVISNYILVYSVGYVGSAVNEISKILSQYTGGEKSDLSEVKNSLMYAALIFIGLKVLAGAFSVGVRLMIIAASRHIEYDLKTTYEKGFKLNYIKR